MLINSVILILREVLEAALMISMLLAVSQKLHLSKKWLSPALLLGVIGATVYALTIQSISEAFDGVGQEIVNASIHSILWLAIAIFIYVLRKTDKTKLVYWLMISCVALAVTREGSEIIIYIKDLLGIPKFVEPVIAGSIMGTGIGISVGVFFYYLIDQLSFRNGLKLGLFLLILVAGGMVMQITQLLLQADIIRSQHAIWNTSQWLNERSLVGQLLYAIMGYEASPTPIQIYTYAITLMILIYLAIKTFLQIKDREPV